MMMASLMLLVVFLLSSCTNWMSSQQNTKQNLTTTVVQLKPAVAVPTECHTTPVYFDSSNNKAGLGNLPWAKTDASSFKVTAYLFFAGPVSSKATIYRPLHTGGKYPDGSTTKVLWVVDASDTPSVLEITGKRLLGIQETFQQTFPRATGSVGDYPSIVNIPTSGCWQLDVKSGSNTATIIFWVISDK